MENVDLQKAMPDPTSLLQRGGYFMSHVILVVDLLISSRMLLAHPPSGFQHYVDYPFYSINDRIQLGKIADLNFILFK